MEGRCCLTPPHIRITREPGKFGPSPPLQLEHRPLPAGARQRSSSRHLSMAVRAACHVAGAGDKAELVGNYVELDTQLLSGKLWVTRRCSNQAADRRVLTAEVSFVVGRFEKKAGLTFCDFIPRQREQIEESSFKLILEYIFIFNLSVENQNQIAFDYGGDLVVWDPTTEDWIGKIKRSVGFDHFLSKKWVNATRKISNRRQSVGLNDLRTRNGPQQDGRSLAIVSNARSDIHISKIIGVQWNLVNARKPAVLNTFCQQQIGSAFQQRQSRYLNTFFGRFGGAFGNSQILFVRRFSKVQLRLSGSYRRFCSGLHVASHYNQLAGKNRQEYGGNRDYEIRKTLGRNAREPFPHLPQGARVLIAIFATYFGARLAAWGIYRGWGLSDSRRRGAWFGASVCLLGCLISLLGQALAWPSE
jgi:hypothetical protein